MSSQRQWFFKFSMNSFALFLFQKEKKMWRKSTWERSKWGGIIGHKIILITTWNTLKQQERKNLRLCKYEKKKKKWRNELRKECSLGYVLTTALNATFDSIINLNVYSQCFCCCCCSHSTGLFFSSSSYC